ncbi:protein FAM81A-like [Babylonia areolata]|uniref:protein FAM81A-like n=1 Tax=Babylonia areolata TaxID=304850 RepID=UPI003FCF47A9
MSLQRRGRNQGYVVNPPWDTTHEYNAIAVGGPRTLPPVVSHREDHTVQEIVPVVSSDIPNRIDVLEERLNAQERTTQGLIDRAFKIKEDVIDSLNFAHGTWNEEKQARGLLQEHIRTITAVVNRLNGDISAIEESIKARDSAHVGTNNAVKNLEVHHVATLTDLKGRIVRCDSAISKLGTDVRSCFDSIRQLNHQQQEVSNRIMDRINGIEQQLIAINNQVERNSGESRMKLTHLEGDTNTQMSMMDAKSRQMVDDVKNMMTSLQTTMDSERERSEQRLLAMIEKSGASKELLLEKLEKRVDDMNYGLEARIIKLEEQLAESRNHIADVQTHLETKLVAKLDSNIKRNAEEVGKLKRECREGFATVHESISNVKTVMEGKRKLLEDQLKKEIGQIRKMVVLV